jgi:hypothetical protein
MARSLNKKYFGNRNIGVNGAEYTLDADGNPIYTGDDQLGGEGVASVTISNTGSYTSALPTAAFTLSDLAGVGGVRATGTVHGKALSAAIGAAGTGYNVGDLLVQHNGATGTYATWKVRSVRVISYTIDTTGQSQFDGDERLALDSTVDSKWTTAFVIDVNGGGLPNYVITASSLQQAGVWNGGTGYTPAPTHIAITAGGAGHVTRGSGDTPNYGATSDNNGAGGFINVVYGIETLDLVTEGDYTAITSGAKALDYTTTGAGTSATATITYGVKGITLTQGGSGYSSPADAAITFSPASTTAAASVLTVGTGVPNTAGNDENAIVIFAVTKLAGEGGTNLQGDIVKQAGARRYKVKTADGTAVCKLKTSGAASELGEMTIVATDASGYTYYVKKLNNHRATLVPFGAGTHEFPPIGTDADGTPSYQAVEWTFNGTSGTKVLEERPYLQTTVNVQLANA